jgi:hypothetical protein
MLKGDNWLEVVCKCQDETPMANLLESHEYFRRRQTIKGYHLEYKAYKDVIGVKLFPKETAYFKEYEYMMLTSPDEIYNQYYVFIQTKSDPTFWCGLTKKSAELFLKKK